MLLLLHVGSDSRLALSLGQLARVVRAAIVGEGAACGRPLEVCAESRGGLVADRKGAQGRKWAHWRHCGCVDVMSWRGPRLVLCVDNPMRAEVKSCLASCNSNSPNRSRPNQDTLVLHVDLIRTMTTDNVR